MNRLFDLVIIGGGAAGQIAAISARRHNPDICIAIVDRTFSLGRKILVCGAGRCNLTNVNLQDTGASGINLQDIINKHYYSSDNRFVYDVISQFDYEHIIQFFEDLGAETYIERKTNIGKVFPVTDSAKTITYLLEKELKKSNVEIFLNTEVKHIAKKDNVFEISSQKVELTARQLEEFSLPTNYNENLEGYTFIAKNVIIAAGGKTYPALGSNGSGFDLANSLGHNIVFPVPSALPLVSNHKLCKLLAGQKMDLQVSSIIDGKVIKTRFDDVMFTEYGLSGPAILNISREISIAINRKQAPLKNIFVDISFLVHANSGVLLSFEEFVTRLNRKSDALLEDALVGILPNKIANTLAKYLGEYSCQDLLDNEKLAMEIYEKLQNIRFEITATRSWNEAEFTAGGIDVSEVDSKSLESKFISNLYFAGEILDVDGDVGGFNLSWAWASGYVAGKNLCDKM